MALPGAKVHPIWTHLVRVARFRVFGRVDSGVSGESVTYHAWRLSVRFNPVGSLPTLSSGLWEMVSGYQTYRMLQRVRYVGTPTMSPVGPLPLRGVRVPRGVLMNDMVDCRVGRGPLGAPGRTQAPRQCVQVTGHLTRELLDCVHL